MVLRLLALALAVPASAALRGPSGKGTGTPVRPVGMVAAPLQPTARTLAALEGLAPRELEAIEASLSLWRPGSAWTPPSAESTADPAAVEAVRLEIESRNAAHEAEVAPMRDRARTFLSGLDALRAELEAAYARLGQGDLDEAAAGALADAFHSIVNRERLLPVIEAAGSAPQAAAAEGPAAELLARLDRQTAAAAGASALNARLLLKGANHDWNNAFQPAMGTAERIKKNPGKASELRGQIERSLERMRDVTASYAAMTESLSETRAKPGKVFLQTLLEKIVLNHDGGPVAVESLRVDRDLTAWASRHHLAVVLDNLIGNAVKYTRPGGSVTVSARREGASVRIVVRDTGIGMTPAQIRGARGGGTTAEARELASGTGVGLPQVERLLESLGVPPGPDGFRLGIESAPGAGSSFSFLLSPAPDGV